MSLPVDDSGAAEHRGSDDAFVPLMPAIAAVDRLDPDNQSPGDTLAGIIAEARAARLEGKTLHVLPHRAMAFLALYAGLTSAEQPEDPGKLRRFRKRQAVVRVLSQRATNAYLAAQAFMPERFGRLTEDHFGLIAISAFRSLIVGHSEGVHVEPFRNTLTGRPKKLGKERNGRPPKRHGETVADKTYLVAPNTTTAEIVAGLINSWWRTDERFGGRTLATPTEGRGVYVGLPVVEVSNMHESFMRIVGAVLERFRANLDANIYVNTSSETDTIKGIHMPWRKASFDNLVNDLGFTAPAWLEDRIRGVSTDYVQMKQNAINLTTYRDAAGNRIRGVEPFTDPATLAHDVAPIITIIRNVFSGLIKATWGPRTNEEQPRDRKMWPLIIVQTRKLVRRHLDLGEKDTGPTSPDVQSIISMAAEAILSRVASTAQGKKEKQVAAVAKAIFIGLGAGLVSLIQVAVVRGIENVSTIKDRIVWRSRDKEEWQRRRAAANLAGISIDRALDSAEAELNRLA